VEGRLSRELSVVAVCVAMVLKKTVVAVVAFVVVVLGGCYLLLPKMTIDLRRLSSLQVLVVSPLIEL
jgi:hypothetical protein